MKRHDEPQTTILTIGRRRAQHAPRVLIEAGRVILRTRCGLDPLPAGFTETRGRVTCDACKAASS